MTNVIDYIELAVEDLAEAKTFYAKALGWTFSDYGPDYAGIQDPRNPGREFREGGAAFCHRRVRCSFRSDRPIQQRSNR